MAMTQRHHWNWKDTCGLCKAEHPLRACGKFIDMEPYERYIAVVRHGYCRNCLARSHQFANCPSDKKCRTCNERHHTMLHDAPQLTGAIQRVAAPKTEFKWASVFVPTATIRVFDEDPGTWTTMRVHLNISSTMSRIAANTFETLNLPTFRHKEHKFATFSIMPRNQRSKFSLKMHALITNELPHKLYSDPISEDPSEDFNKNSLADIDPCCNTPVQIEIGADYYSRLRHDGVIITGMGSVDAYNTALGYVFAGPVQYPFKLEDSS